MGCSESKEQVTGGAAAPRSTGATHAVDSVHSKSMMVKKDVKPKAHHLKNIFASPLGDVSADYKPPKYPKSSQEKAFLKQAMTKNFVFETMNDKQMHVLMDAFQKIDAPKGDSIITQGEEGDYFYVIQKGQVIFKVDGKQVGEAKAGDSFGELALLYKAPRAASVVSTSPVELYRLDQKTFRTILQSQTKQADSKKKELLKNIAFLEELDEGDLNKLIDALVPHPFKAKETLVKKGTQGDIFYILQEGNVKVTDISIGGTSYEDQELGPGDYFGERALVTSEPRSANCIASTDGIALTVDAETFKLVMGDLKRLVLKSGDKRKLAAIKAFAGTPPEDLASLAGSITEKTFKEATFIAKEGDTIETVLFLLRPGGKLQISSRDGAHDQIIEGGSYFAEELNLLPKKGSRSTMSSTTSKFTIKILKDTTAGVLTLNDCVAFLDSAGPSKTAATKVVDVPYKALKKHKILGAGTFGQVWLVSVKDNNSGERSAYALKIQSKHDLVDQDMAKGVVQEMRIMRKLDHPFIIKLVSTYQDKQRVYMLVSLVQGGELFSVIHRPKADGVPESQAQFYAAGILAGLGYMHRRNIIYRDLKPENVLVDKEGYPVIIDMGFAKIVPEKTYTFCGTPLYVAPEIVMNKGHDKGADHWSLGVLAYEMIDGETPFWKEGMSQMALFKAIVKGTYSPSSRPMSKEAEDFVKCTLTTDPTHRLGSLARGVKDLFTHRWFADMEFKKLQLKELKAPFVPKVKDPLDCSAFEDWSHLDDKDKQKDPPISKKDQAIFKDF